MSLFPNITPASQTLYTFSSLVVSSLTSMWIMPAEQKTFDEYVERVGIISFDIKPFILFKGLEFHCFHELYNGITSLNMAKL